MPSRPKNILEIKRKPLPPEKFNAISAEERREALRRTGDFAVEQYMQITGRWTKVNVGFRYSVASGRVQEYVRLYPTGDTIIWYSIDRGTKKRTIEVKRPKLMYFPFLGTGHSYIPKTYGSGNTVTWSGPGVKVGYPFAIHKVKHKIAARRFNRRFYLPVKKKATQEIRNATRRINRRFR